LDGDGRACTETEVYKCSISSVWTIIVRSPGILSKIRWLVMTGPTGWIRDSVQRPKRVFLWTGPRHYAFCGESSDDWPVFSDEDEYHRPALRNGIGPDSPRLALSQPAWFEGGTYGRSKHMSADDLASKQRPWPFGRPSEDCYFLIAQSSPYIGACERLSGFPVAQSLFKCILQ
jgi:hypothetical protein